MVFDHNSYNFYDITRPIKYQDPKFTRRYDMVVIGGGVGGLTVAKNAVRMGAKVAVIERKFLGGQKIESIMLSAFSKCAQVA